MRHRRVGRELSRTREHRRALLRNLVTELFRHERITTTEAKAKEARREAERLITFAKRGDLHARRHVDRFIMSPDVTRKLFSTIAPWYEERAGGYTRVIKTRHRLGDGAEMAFLELVKTEEQKAADRKAREAAAAAKEEKKERKKKGAEAEEPADVHDEEKAEKKAKPAKAAKPAKVKKTGGGGGLLKRKGGDKSAKKG